MAGIEEVIRGLECCTKKVCIYEDTLKECPYWELCGICDGAFEDCTTALAKDALTLLKAQEPVEPQHLHDKSRLPVRCGNCGALIIIFRGFGDDDYKAKFCCECGRAVKWE